jgi:hypothetical protein
MAVLVGKAGGLTGTASSIYKLTILPYAWDFAKWAVSILL